MNVPTWEDRLDMSHGLLPRTPIDAPDRSVCQYTGELADGLSFPALLPAAHEVAELREHNRILTAERDEALADAEKLRHEIDALTDLLKASGAHIACLSTNVAMYQTERDEYRERADEWRDKYEGAQCRMDEMASEIRELTQRLADAETARDTAQAQASYR